MSILKLVSFYISSDTEPNMTNSVFFLIAHIVLFMAEKRCCQKRHFAKHDNAQQFELFATITHQHL